MKLSELLLHLHHRQEGVPVGVVDERGQASPVLPQHLFCYLLEMVGIECEHLLYFFQCLENFRLESLVEIRHRNEVWVGFG